MLEKVKLIMQFDGCAAYDCGSMYYIRLSKGAHASDHCHPEAETVFLMEGEAEFILEDERQIIRAPVKITIPANAYHKFTALTDVVGLEVR